MTSSRQQHSDAAPVDVRSRDNATESFLTANVPSPFTGLLPGSTINGATVQRQQLLRRSRNSARSAPRNTPGPIATTPQRADREALPRSELADRAHVVVAAYKLNYFSTRRTVCSRIVSPNDRPHRFSGAATFLLPFGRGQKWGSDWNGLVDAIAGGWQVSGTYQYQNGAPLVFTTSTYFDAACDLGGLTSSIGTKTGNSISGWTRQDGICRASTSMTPPCRRAAWTIPSSSARISAFSWEQRALFPVDAAAHADRRRSPAGPRHLEAVHDAARHDVPDPHRDHQRAELHGALESGPESTQLHLRVRQPGPQPAISNSARGSPSEGAKVPSL